MIQIGERPDAADRDEARVAVLGENHGKILIELIHFISTFRAIDKHLYCSLPDLCAISIEVPGKKSQVTAFSILSMRCDACAK
ncbi:MAG TPA: hypothetical protein VFY26_17550 [Anaerolineales bacterium]|nr:hypothetical protein [Anaerolineales bacterium]